MATLSKEEYLKRYLSDIDNKEKTKKRKKPVKKKATVKSRIKILDDDIDVNALMPENIGNTLDEDVGDNNPTVADVIDERPDHVKQLEKYRQDDRWKLLAEETGSARGRGEKSHKAGAKSSRRHDSDVDQSPTRGYSRHESDDDQLRAKIQNRCDADSDQSPARTRKRMDSDSDQSPARTRKRMDSDSDQSPARTRKRMDSDSDQSPARTRKRMDSDSDQSPARTRKRMDSDSDQSPVRTRMRHDNDSDQSPARKQKKRLFNDKSDSKSDHSIPRKHRRISGGDLSPPRLRNDSDQSPVRKQKRCNSDSDQSPVRKQKYSASDSDHSPVRGPKYRSDSHQQVVKKHRKKSRFDQPSDDNVPKRQQDNDERVRSRSSDKMRTTLSGAKAGLSSAKMLREETEMLKRKEKEMFDQIGEDKLGRYAKPVFRDKTGKRRNLDREAEEDAEKAKKQEAKNKKYQEWGKGLAQAAQQEQNLEDAVHEMQKPLARYKDDADLDDRLRAQERAGDPMLAFLSKKKKKNTDKKKELPKYKGPEPPPNRFNIRPGYRWDGVDRSNGFEKKLFATATSKKALAEEAYKWSVEDM